MGLEQDGTIDKNKMKNWYNSNTQEGVQMVFHKKNYSLNDLATKSYSSLKMENSTTWMYPRKKGPDSLESTIFENNKQNII